MCVSSHSKLTAMPLKADFVADPGLEQCAANDGTVNSFDAVVTVLKTIRQAKCHLVIIHHDQSITCRTACSLCRNFNAP